MRGTYTGLTCFGTAKLFFVAAQDDVYAVRGDGAHKHSLWAGLSAAAIQK